jgi:hypothetical protein
MVPRVVRAQARHPFDPQVVEAGVVEAAGQVDPADRYGVGSLQAKTRAPSTNPVTSSPATRIANRCHPVGSKPSSTPPAIVVPVRRNCQVPSDPSRSATGAAQLCELPPPVERAPIAA